MEHPPTVGLLAPPSPHPQPFRCHPPSPAPRDILTPALLPPTLGGLVEGVGKAERIGNHQRYRLPLPLYTEAYIRDYDI